MNSQITTDIQAQNPPMNPESILKILKGEKLTVLDIYEIDLKLTSKDGTFKSVHLTNQDALNRLSWDAIKRIEHYIDEGLTRVVFHYAEKAQYLSNFIEQRKEERMKEIETVDNSKI